MGGGHSTRAFRAAENACSGEAALETATCVFVLSLRLVEGMLLQGFVGALHLLGTCRGSGKRVLVGWNEEKAGTSRSSALPPDTLAGETAEPNEKFSSRERDVCACTLLGQPSSSHAIRRRRLRLLQSFSTHQPRASPSASICTRTTPRLIQHNHGRPGQEPFDTKFPHPPLPPLAAKRTVFFALSRSVDWRRSANLDAAFAASASATGLDSAPLAETFGYEVDLTCGGVLGAAGSAKSSPGVGSRHGPGGGGGGSWRAAPRPSAAPTSPGAPAPLPVTTAAAGEELYSPGALSFVSPVLEVKWPVGVLLPTGVLHTYGGIHRSLFRHQLSLHRLRRLRVALRELDARLDASGGGSGGGGGRGRSSATRRRRGGGGGGGGSSGERQQGADVSWDRGRLHWLHLFRHEMQHMADSLQVSESCSGKASGGRWCGGLVATVLSKGLMFEFRRGL